MPLEIGAWRIDQGVDRLDFAPLDLECRLQRILAADITIADPNWMVIGLEEAAVGGRVDILAIDRDGNLVVLELKRDRTPRDIVAQVLDYGSWVRDLRDDDIARIFDRYLRRHHPEKASMSIDEAFCAHFRVQEMPGELNDTHQLVIVASGLDQSTERIVRYLAEEHDVNINAIFFRVFQDEGREYLVRAWLHEPSASEATTAETGIKGEWNGEYYVSFGLDEQRTWDDAVKYGFISGGGGSWYTNTLSMLSPGDRIWVNVPGGVGYVGVGRVVDSVVPIDEFMVRDDAGREVPITSVPVKAAAMTKAADDPERAEHLVRVEWIKTVPVAQAVKEKGLFGNQNTVARPTTPKWDHTVERLKKRFGVQ